MLEESTPQQVAVESHLRYLIRWIQAAVDAYRKKLEEHGPGKSAPRPDAEHAVK